MNDEVRAWYRLHVSTLLIGGLVAVVVGYFLTTDSLTISFSGKNTAAGFPWTYRTQVYRNRAAFGPTLSASRGDVPREGYDLIADSGIDYKMLSIDILVSVLLVIVPAGSWEFLMRRRRKRTPGQAV